MVNHFRTLLLNQLPNQVRPQFGEFIPSAYMPVLASVPEKLIRGILLGGSSDRSAQEFGATVVFRLMYDNLFVRKMMDETDSRLTFDPMSAYVTDLSQSNIDYPTIPVMWSAIERSKALSGFFRTLGSRSGDLLKVMEEFGRAERLDSKIALVGLALCLRSEEKLLDA